MPRRRRTSGASDGAARRRARVKLKRPPLGARPGTLAIPEGAPPPALHAMRYDADTLEDLGTVQVGDLAALQKAGQVLWVDVHGLGDEKVLRAMSDLYGLHPLALEDVVHVGQRPKTEGYERNQLYITRMVVLKERADPSVQPGELRGDLAAEQVSLVFDQSVVLSFQERQGDVFEPVRERLRQNLGPMRRSGADYLAYALIDAVIDGYYPVLEALGDCIEELEDIALGGSSDELLGRINAIRRDLLMLRRAILPQRDAVNSLIRDEGRFVSDTVRVYLRDCYDHCVQLTESVDTLRELSSGLLNTYLSAVANRTNDVMKVLTIMASIFIPLTFLAGIYGMNFEHMPELAWVGSYPTLLTVMLALGVLMLAYFRRLGWIGGRKR